MSEIALAYSSIDKSRAEAVAKVLGALGYTVAPQPLTANHVDACKALIVFWSSGSVNSLPINQFAQQASLSRKLVSVRAGQADPPAAFALVALHDLSRWTGSLEFPELRTFLQHVLRMAPPANPSQQIMHGAAVTPPARPQAPQAPAGQPFNFAGPMGAGVRPAERPVAQPAPQPQTQPQPQQMQAPPPQATPRPAPQAYAPLPEPTPAAARPRETRASLRDRPSVRRADERRRAAGGGVARVAFGAIAVSVMAGAAVAAFNYEGGQQRTAAAPQPPTSPQVVVSVAPNALTPDVATDAPPAIAPAAGVQVASAEPLPTRIAEPSPAPAPPATVQSARGWTASLPTMPGPRAIPVSAGAAPVSRPVGLRTTVSSGVSSGPLTPIDGRARPAPTDLVAIDNANLGDDTAAPRPRTPEEQRAWVRKDTEYGPAQ